MRIRKSVLVVLAVVSVLMLAVLACGGGGQTEEPTAPPVEETAVVTEPAGEEATLDWTLTPNFGEIELETGFLPDPHAIQIASGGTVDVNAVMPDCRGYATASPDLNLRWTGNNGSLRIFFVPDDGTSDTTLIINDASANWLCNDDAYSFNPGIDIEEAASGLYSIWVGSYFSDEVVPGTLYITELDITPDTLGGAVEPPVAVEGTGQWAISATASSEYGTSDWTAMQATGEPDTAECGDYGTAWATAGSDEVAWLELEYGTPVIPTQINIYETYNPDAVSMVTVTDATGTIWTVYEADPVVETECPLILSITVEGITAPVSIVTVHLDQSVTSWNEIDAVELVGTPG